MSYSSTSFMSSLFLSSHAYFLSSGMFSELALSSVQSLAPEWTGFLLRNVLENSCFAIVFESNEEIHS